MERLRRGIMFNRIPNVAVGELTPSGAKKDSEEYKQNLKEYNENFDKSKRTYLLS